MSDQKPTTRSSSSRLRSSKKRRGDGDAALSHVSISSRFRPDLNDLIHVPLDAKFEFGWEITSGLSEHLLATFSGAELLNIAAERGMLRVTTSGERRVPKGIAAAQQVIANA